MLRLTANKTKLYTLVAGYVENLPPMRGGTIFVKYPRTPDYAMDWITPEWNKAHAFFSTCMGRPPPIYRDPGRRNRKDGKQERLQPGPAGPPGAGHGGGVHHGGGAPADRKGCRQWRTFSRYLIRNTA